jgi:hypothetical protein
MSEDNLLLLYCYIIYAVTLGVLVSFHKQKVKVLLTNVIILMGYSAWFLYNLFYNSEGGVGLVWLVYLMIFIGFHFLINVIGIVVAYFKLKKADQEKDYS